MQRYRTVSLERWMNGTNMVLGSWRSHSTESLFGLPSAWFATAVEKMTVLAVVAVAVLANPTGAESFALGTPMDRR